MEEFSDIPQADLSENKITDIPIFNVSEIIPLKIILHHLEKNTPPPSTSKDKKVDKQDDLTQALFDYVSEQAEVSVASISGIFETSKTPESLINKPEVSKPLESNESNNEVVDILPKETSNKRDSSKPINEVSSAILLSRVQ